MINEPSLPTATCNPTGLIPTRHVTSHSLFEGFPVTEGLGHETQDGTNLFYGEMALFADRI